MPARVLLVEDEHDLAQPVAMALTYAGHAVTTAHDGQDGLSLALSDAFDVVLLDLRMPNMDGVTFLGVVRAYLRLADLPVFLITALPTAHPQVTEAQRLGVGRVFRKGSFTLDEIVAAVEDLQAV